MMFTQPMYAKNKEISKYPSLQHYIVRILGSIFLVKFGYELAHRDFQEENNIYHNNKVVQFESEEQIFDFLFNKEKSAVFLQFYTPGHSIDAKFLKTMETESMRPEYEDIVFMSVHCRKHLTFCSNKAFPDRIFPMAELYYINEQDQIELTDMASMHRSKAGVRGFFEQSGIIEQEYHPEQILERAGRKLL